MRLKLIQSLLAQGAVRTQADLQHALAEKGLVVTQATISRDLRDLRARKADRSDGGSGYYLPEAEQASYLRPPKDQALRRALAGSVTSVLSSGDLVLVKTLPAHAPYVASLVDEAGIARVLGTVAGDDTVLVVAEESYGAIVRELLKDLAAVR